MAGSGRQRKPSFSLMSMLKSRKGASSSSSQGQGDPYAYCNCNWEEAHWGRKVYPSDEDTRYCVAEPGIDHRASVFIAKFHEARRSEVHTLYN